MTDTPQIPPYAAGRADYARERDADALGALVTAVAQDSPAYDAGIERGMRAGSTDGTRLGYSAAATALHICAEAQSCAPQTATPYSNRPQLYGKTVTFRGIFRTNPFF